MTKNEKVLKILDEAMETIGEFHDDDFADAVYVVEYVENIIAKAMKELRDE